MEALDKLIYETLGWTWVANYTSLIFIVAAALALILILTVIAAAVSSKKSKKIKKLQEGGAQEQSGEQSRSEDEIRAELYAEVEQNVRAQVEAEYADRMSEPQPQYADDFGANDGQIAELNATIEQKDTEISALYATIAQKDDQIAAMSAMSDSSDSNGQVSALNAELDQKNERINELNQAVAQKDEQIAALAASSDNGKQIAALNQAITQKDARIAELKESVAASDARVDSLTTSLTRSHETINELNKEIRALRADLDKANGNKRTVTREEPTVRPTVKQRPASTVAPKSTITTDNDDEDEYDNEFGDETSEVKVTLKFDRLKNNWTVLRSDTDRVYRRVATKQEALVIAKDLAKRLHAQLVVHKKDGKFQKI